MSSGFIHVVVCIRTSFFFEAQLYSVVLIYYIFVYPFIHLGYFHLLAVVSNAVMKAVCKYLFESCSLCF